MYKPGQTSYGATIASYLVGIRALAHGVKWPVWEADHSPYLVLSLRMRVAIPSLLIILMWHAKRQCSLLK